MELLKADEIEVQMQVTCVFLKNLKGTMSTFSVQRKESSYTSSRQDSNEQVQVVLAEVGMYTLAVFGFMLFNTVSNFTIINGILKLLLNHVVKYCIGRM